MTTMRMLWISLDKTDHGVKTCEAERHEGRGIPARWVVVITDTPDGDMIFAACQECMTFMAADLGTTPERGAYNP